MGEDRRLHGFVELRAGVGVAMHAPLLHHHVALRRHDVVAEREAGHAIRLIGHHQTQMLLGDTLKIGRVIVAGKGVLLSADLRDRLRERALGVLVRALEHQMFEEMGDARLSRRIVRRAVAIPHHMRHHRRPMIGDDDDCHSVVELGLDDLGALGQRLGEGGRCGVKRHGGFTYLPKRRRRRAYLPI